MPAESPLLDFGKVHTVAPQLNSVEGQDDICTMINRFTVPFGIQLSNHLYVVPLCPRMFSRVTSIGAAAAAVATPAWTWALTHVYRYYTSSFDFLIHNPSTDSFVVVGFMPNRGVIGRGKFSNMDEDFPEFITLPVVDGTAVLWPISFNGPHIDVLEPRVNPWLMVSTSKYSKPTRVDQWVVVEPETQKLYPEDVRTGSNGNLLFHMQNLTTIS